MDILTFFLERAGFFCTTFSYHSFFADLDAITGKLDAAIDELSQKTGKKPILVGHSLGGVLIRLWLSQKEHNEDKIAGVITLGTPHHGSKVAWLGQGRLVRNLVPGSQFLLCLNKKEHLYTIPCVSLCSPADELVLPAEFLLPPCGWKIRLLANSSHVGMLFRHDTVLDLLDELQEISGSATG